MDLAEFKIRNKVFEYNITDDELKTLEENYNKNIDCGTFYIFKKDEYVYGVNYDKSYHDKGNKIIREKNKDIKIFPSIAFKGLNIGFDLLENDIKHISVIKNNFTDYKDFQISELNPEKIRNNITQVKAFLRDVVLKKNNRYNSSDDNTFNDDVLETIYWIFDTEFDSDIKEIDIKDSFSKIIKVWEENNIRYSLAVVRKDRDKEYSLKKFEHTDEKYNYVDEGRVFIGNKFIWDDLDVEKTQKEFINKIGNNNDFVLITAEEYDKAVRKYQFKIKKEQEDEELKATIKKEIENKLKNLSETNTIILGGIKFTDKGIYYQ